jgi:predicted ATPase
MALHELWVEGYRSIRALRLPLTPVTVVVGPNGCGETGDARVGEEVSAEIAGSTGVQAGISHIHWGGNRGNRGDLADIADGVT